MLTYVQVLGAFVGDVERLGRPVANLGPEHTVSRTRAMRKDGNQSLTLIAAAHVSTLGRM
jgi:hypothetical protein